MSEFISLFPASRRYVISEDVECLLLNVLQTRYNAIFLPYLHIKCRGYLQLFNERRTNTGASETMIHISLLPVLRFGQGSLPFHVPSAGLESSR